MTPPFGVGWYTSPTRQKPFYAGVGSIDGEKVGMRLFYLELVEANKI